ncbi:MAG: uroporphyrinogen decarboxylase family protein [Phycisphaerae bacterium]
MTGYDRVTSVVKGGCVDRPPLLPILHSGLAGLFGIRLGDYFTDAATMAQVAVEGCRRFGFDGIQLSLGVTGEAESLGASVDQPPDGAPVLRQHLLANLSNLNRLKPSDAACRGRMPLFLEALRRVKREAGTSLFSLATLRGPLNITAQLRGIEDTLVDMIESPDQISRILDFAVDVAIAASEAVLAASADGVIFGEATCSPNFISPEFYRRLILPRHKQLVRALRSMGWKIVGFHVCGNILPILDDLVSTGADLIDLDYQVPAHKAIERAAGRITLRGNLDPSSVFRFGDPARIRMQTRELCRAVSGAKWILSSGCDIPPGTPAEILQAFAESSREP